MEKGPIPGWAWIFAVACGLIPVITLGGAIPGAIGFGGAGGCISIARDESKAVATRVGLCLGITATCWVTFAALVATVLSLSN
jgi:hypothetical protein